MSSAGRQTPIRILHVVRGMNPGGVETWLMHVLRHIDRRKFQFDFLTHTRDRCFYDQEIQHLGGRIIPCMHPSWPWCYAKNFSRALSLFGPYDVVHSHVHHFSGFVLTLAARANVPIRIAHSHNDLSTVDRRAGIMRRLYLTLSKRLIARHATVGLACSNLAAAALFDAAWQTDPRFKVLYCGIDLKPFQESVDREHVRKELGLPPEAFVCGHVGRFAEQKNHDFLVDIFSLVAKDLPKASLLLIGDGPLRTKIEEKVRRLGLDDRVIFAGVRADVPRLMLGAMDCFVFPSFHEGLPLVLLEAQAANLPCIISNTISDEVDCILSRLSWK